MDHLGDVLTVLIVSVFYKENSQKIQVHSRPSLRRFNRTATLIGFRTLEHLKVLKHLLATLPHRISLHTSHPGSYHLAALALTVLPSLSFPGANSQFLTLACEDHFLPLSGTWATAGTLVLREGCMCSPFTLYPALIRLAF